MILDPKTKNIFFVLHTIHLITYITIKLVHYYPYNFTKYYTKLLELPYIQNPHNLQPIASPFQCRYPKAEQVVGMRIFPQNMDGWFQ
jgi:hypothetical protein